MSENSYIRDFSAQVSQIVFLHLIWLFYDLLQHVWPEMSENSYLRHFSAQVSQIVFLSYLTVLRLKTTGKTWNVTKLISPPFQCTSITNRVLRLIWPFYGFLQLYDLKCQKTHISTISVHKYHKSCSYFIWPFYSLIKTVWPEMSENSYIRDFSAQVSQIVFLSYLTVLRFITTVWPEMSENSYLRHFRCTSITNRFLILFDRFKT